MKPVSEMVTFRAASDRSLLVSFEAENTPGCSAGVIALTRALQAAAARGIRNLHPAYRTLLIAFDSLALDHAEVEALVRRLLDEPASAAQNPREVEIPVAYGGEYGPDLADIAALRGISPAEAIALHSGSVYTVCFIGFVPGFAYLAGLPESLATPRLQSPRKRTPVGSVGIAGAQTGVYPIDTPGGWRIVGRTPLELFNPAREGMSLLEIGDRVRFRPL